MRIFAGFLKERAREILLYIITLALLKFVFFLYNLPSDALNYGFLLVLVLAGILFFIDFCEFYKRHKELVLVEKNMQDALLDLPEPDTPVTQVKVPSGMDTSIFFRLFSAAPCTVSQFPFPLRRTGGTGTFFLRARYSPVRDLGLAATSSGVPAATISPPWIPAPGPTSMI